MNTRTRDLHHQIMDTVTRTEGRPLPHSKAFAMRITGITPGVKGLTAIQGTPVETGVRTYPNRISIYLVRTFHRRGDIEVAIYNVVIMDKAGDIRLLLDARADARSKKDDQELRQYLTELLAEHDELNNSDLSANHQVKRALDRIVNLIPYWNTEKWTKWITYLLEALRDKTDLATYEEFLEQVGDAIATRMVTGRW